MTYILKLQKQYQTIMKTNKELDLFNKKFLEEKDSNNLGKCFKFPQYSGSYFYCKIIQIAPEFSSYKLLCVCVSGISIRYWSFIEGYEKLSTCSVEEFDNAYNEVINNALANKVIK